MQTPFDAPLYANHVFRPYHARPVRVVTHKAILARLVARNGRRWPQLLDCYLACSIDAAAWRTAARRLHREQANRVAPLRLRDLPCGAWFSFVDSPNFEYQANGNGWYGRPFSGGPWCEDSNPLVIRRDAPAVEV